jgi:hypothetical protein
VPHPNQSKLIKYPVQEFHEGKASRIHGTVWYLRRGEVFELNGKKCFVMGGAVSVDKMWRVPGQGWWPLEVPSQTDLPNAQDKLALHNDTVDLVFTHTCPISIKSKISLHGHAGSAEKLDLLPTQSRGRFRGCLLLFSLRNGILPISTSIKKIDERFT